MSFLETVKENHNRAWDQVINNTSQAGAGDWALVASEIIAGAIAAKVGLGAVRAARAVDAELMTQPIMFGTHGRAPSVLLDMSPSPLRTQWFWRGEGGILPSTELATTAAARPQGLILDAVRTGPNQFGLDLAGKGFTVVK